MILFGSRRVAEYWYMLIVIVLLCALACPVCLLVARRIKFTRDQVANGWLPIICAVIISNIAGLIFSKAEDFPGSHVAYVHTFRRLVCAHLLTYVRY